ncbi:MAG: tRNA (adenosine(37)-N6)-threonylcarbamoyltransferase complex transferase subunit TsaD [Candidatus Obscuribacterales bacterium]|nr:tRNA (adenosine(37)-N6)-threonylcarbamoyltransferase complex transferase subunit TsaD [Candidatus Obscuribacterales bacterium]
MAVYLAVETSCDETAAAVVADGRKVLSSIVVSQIEIHKKYGGVVPEVAARKHLETVNHVIAEALDKSGLTFKDLDGIAYTAGPGLVGTLLSGMLAAKSLAWAHDLPLIAVDHLLAHVAANYLNSSLEPPFIALLVSGGHTQIIYFKDYQTSEILGKTLDDAAGEAYDKVARLLGLPYPGGAVIDKLAQSGNPQAFKFPEGVVAGYNFSFSGLKTAVLRTVDKLEKPLPLEDLAASFQEAVSRVLLRKTLKAQEEKSAPAIVLAGGVAANKTLRAKLDQFSPVPVFYPKMEFCTDNAAMVAAAAHFCGQKADLSSTVYSRKKD